MLRVVLVVFATAWMSGCNSPTLPLPPPSRADIEASLDIATSVARITGLRRAVEPHALVTCFNNRTGIGSVGLASDQGSFEIDVPADEGDVIEVWQRVGNDPPSIVVTVK